MPASCQSSKFAVRSNARRAVSAYLAPLFTNSPSRTWFMALITCDRFVPTIAFIVTCRARTRMGLLLGGGRGCGSDLRYAAAADREGTEKGTHLSLLLDGDLGDHAEHTAVAHRVPGGQ